MNKKSQAIALGAGLTGIAAMVGAAPFIVATGCALVVREAFRDSKEYEEGTTTKTTSYDNDSSYINKKIRF